jgi:hypothetical protein
MLSEKYIKEKVSDPLCLSSSSSAHHFYNYSFIVNQDDQHLLAHTMASDSSVAWHFSQRELVFLRIKLHTLIRLITEEICMAWPRFEPGSPK